MADSQTENRIRKLEREVSELTKRIDELTRLLKRSPDPVIQRAARKAK
jgi:hypothetical protein